MFWNLLAIEHFKNFRRWILRIEILVLCSFISLSFLGRWITIYNYDQSQPAAEETRSDENAGSGMFGLRAAYREEMVKTVTWPEAFSVSFQLGDVLNFFLVIVLVCMMTSQEYGWRTMSTWPGRGAQRILHLFAKFSSFVLPISFLVIVPFLFTALVSGVFTYAYRGGIDVSVVDGWLLCKMIGVTVFGLILYAAAAFFLSILTRSAVAAFGIGFAYFVIVENIAGGILYSIGKDAMRVANYFPGLMASAVTRFAESGFQPGSAGAMPTMFTVDIPTAALGVIVYIAVFLSLSVAVYYRQNLGG